MLDGGVGRLRFIDEISLRAHRVDYSFQIDRIRPSAHETVQNGKISIDTASVMGKFLLTVFAGLAELERSLIRDRTEDGRIAAKTVALNLAVSTILPITSVKKSCACLVKGLAFVALLAILMSV